MNQDKTQTSAELLSNGQAAFSESAVAGSDLSAENDVRYLVEQEKLRTACHKLAFFRALEELDSEQHAIALSLSDLVMLGVQSVMLPTSNDDKLCLITSGSVDVYREGRYCATLVAGDCFGEELRLLHEIRAVEYVSSPNLSRPTELVVMPVSSVFEPVSPAGLKPEVLSFGAKRMFIRMYVQRLAWRLERLRISNPSNTELASLTGLQKIDASMPKQEMCELIQQATNLLALTIQWQEHNAPSLNE